MSVLSEDQLLCCICLEVFSQPVTIPCGHNFCKCCIKQHWSLNSSPCRCPLCKKQFATQPELPVNTFISEIAADFRKSAGKRSGGVQTQVSKPGEISCDVCTGTKLKAAKSCLTCLVSYCPVHLDPHHTSDRLKTHFLVEPVDDLEERLCVQHKRPLELYCKFDRVCLCSLCSVLGHSGHSIVSLEDECEARRPELQHAVVKVQETIKEIGQKRQRIKLMKRHSQEDAEREIASGVRVFTALIQTAEKGMNELIEQVEKKQKTMDKEADIYINELEGELTTLQKRSAELEHVSKTKDYLQILQNIPLLTKVPPPRRWMEVQVDTPPHSGSTLKAVDELDKTLDKTLDRERKLLVTTDRLRTVQQYAVDLVLHPDTAHPWLLLSDDGKQVRSGEVKRDLPDNPERFSLYTHVLASQSFSCGRFYYEVEVTGKSDWTIGVASSSVNRKSIVPISPVNGYWAVSLRNGNEFMALASPVFGLPLSSLPRTVGVYVSYEEGLVSFHNVLDAAHIYSFTNCCFTQELFPLFSPGLNHGGANAKPLTISSVNCSL